MEIEAHVVYREMLHVVSGAFCLLTLQAAWVEIRRRGWAPKLPGLLFLLPPALVVGLLVAAREPYDSAGGDPAWKSTLDGVFWVVGLALAAWLQIRYRARNFAWTETAVRQMGPRAARRLGLGGGGW